MSDRSIPLREHEVRGILDGRQTQLRRVLKPQPPDWCYQDQRPGYSVLTPKGHIEFRGRYVDPEGVDYGPASKFIALPYAIGDRLWVRETWRMGAWDWDNHQIAIDYCDGPRKEWLEVDEDYDDRLITLIEQSRADAEKAGLPLPHTKHEYSWWPGDSPCRWRPSIHMPRWASRLTLTVTDVRVQQLQEISEDDAVAEGLEHRLDWLPQYRGAPDLPWRSEFPRDAFRDLWDSINAKRAGASWDDNPWVVAVTFTSERRNIGAGEAA